MRFDDVTITHLSRKPARIARWVVILAPLWMIFGSIAIGTVVHGELVFLNVFVSFVSFLVAAVTALAFRGGTELGVLRTGAKGALSVATGGILARIGDRELSDRVVSGVRERVSEVDQVVLELSSGDSMIVGVRDAEEADALLGAAGVRADQRAVALRIGTVQTPLFRALLAIFYLLGLFAGVPATVSLLASLTELASRHPHTVWFFEASVVVTAIAWMMVLLTHRALAVRIVRIGRDGVLVDSGRFSKVFLPFDGLRLRRVGARVGLRTGERTARVACSSEDEAALLVWHIERAKAAHDRREQLGATILGRNGRDLKSWRSELRALLGEQGYRAPVAITDVAAIVEDPRAPRDQRIGAALAIAALPESAPERARLRVAIETTADPHLRVALERAAEDELEPDLVEKAEAW